jgi:hypothetical protein
VLTGVLPWATLAVLSSVTLALRRPWTGLLAQGRYAPQIRSHPLFHEANLVITAAWTGYFAVAAATTALTTPWAAVAWAAPTPLLGWCSFRAGDRYATRRLRVSGTEGATGPEGENMSVSDDQARLRRQIADLSDEDVLEFAGRQPGGMAALVELTMAGMPAVLDPAVAQDCVIGYEITAPVGPLAYRIEVAAGHASVAHRSPDDARVVLQLGAADFLRLITGLADGTDLFMTGRMRIRGDLMFAPRVGAMFATAAHRG